jgi:SAM-dependent methyltransferase
VLELQTELNMPCPLCDCPRHQNSWLGSTLYRGKEYFYQDCLGCGSIYCDPMPDAEALAQMYGPAYGSAFQDEPGVPDPKEPRRVVESLAGLGPGLFIDYGCGAGNLLAEVARLGWKALGVELDARVAEQTARRTGLRVVSAAEVQAEVQATADALHLGDVIEHLTRPNEQMPPIVNLVKPGGLLIAQGPLEANANLFQWALRAGRAVRRRRPSAMPPYHVSLATCDGQRAFFLRFGLKEVLFSMHEVAWPAPGCLAVADIARPRALALFTVRKVSQLLSRLRPRAWGNRYFYIGRKPQ